MKKFIAACAFAVLLAGCGQATTSQESTEPAAATAPAADESMAPAEASPSYSPPEDATTSEQSSPSYSPPEDQN